MMFLKYGKLSANQLFNFTIGSVISEKNPDRIADRIDEALLHVDIDERLFKIKVLKPSDKDPEL